MLDVLIPAVLMQGVSTLHVANAAGRIEHVFAAYRTVAVQQPFDTFVSVFKVDVEASIARLQYIVSLKK